MKETSPKPPCPRADCRREHRSSAIQVLPAIQPHVESVTTFIRSPTYIAPPIGPSGQREYTADEKRAFETQPGALLSHRKDMENGMNSLFGACRLLPPLKSAR